MALIKPPLIPKIEQKKIHSRLTVFKDVNNSKLVGYVNFDHEDEAWIFVVQDFVSDFYQEFDDAARALCEMYITKKYDVSFAKAGLITNEDYVRGL